MQERCRDAWEQAQSAEGLERMRLINLAFPYAVRANANSPGLRILWNNNEKCWTVCDTAGFITLVPKDDVATLLVMIGMESALAGAVRDVVEGRERKERRKVEPPPPPVKKKKLTLGDLGL